MWLEQADINKTGCERCAENRVNGLSSAAVSGRSVLNVTVCLAVDRAYACVIVSQDFGARENLGWKTRHKLDLPHTPPSTLRYEVATISFSPSAREPCEEVVAHISPLPVCRIRSSYDQSPIWLLAQPNFARQRHRRGHPLPYVHTSMLRTKCYLWRGLRSAVSTIFRASLFHN